MKFRPRSFCIVSLLLLAAPALAQPSAQNEAQALALFKDALAALDKNDYAAACPEFDAAMKLFPSPSTELNLARCFEHDGKLASAWAAYQRVLVLNRDTREQKRREALDKLANDGAAALGPRLPKLRVVVQPAPPGLAVTEDGQELPPASFGLPLPVDPGAHDIKATAPGFSAFQQTATAAEDKTTDVAVTLTALPPALPPAPITAPPPPPPSPVDTTPKRGIRPWAWVVGGTGLAMGAVAIAFRVDWGNVDAKQQAAGCGADLQSCPRTYTTLGADNAEKDRDRALFIGLGVGSILAAGAGVLGIVAGSVHKAEPRDGRVRVVPLIGGANGAAVAGSF